MFKQLRNKFLILNLIIISILMLAAFLSIYGLTYTNVYRDIDRELHRISEFSRKKDGGPSQPPLDRDLNSPPPPPNRSVSFVLITDGEGTLVHIASIFDMDNTFYESAKEASLSRDTNTGTFKMDGTYWAFMTRPHFDGYNKIIFLDVTSQLGILTNLIYTFLAVALIMLIFIFFISRFFANRSIKPIKEAFDKQKQFIADVSHELKTPLTVINTNVDVLLSNRQESINDQVKWLHYIKSETERMTRLTNDLLYLAQIDYSNMKMIYSNFDFSEAAEDVLLTMEAVIFENNISLQYNIEPNVFLYGNREQLQQVIMILLDNAIKYTNNQGYIDFSLKKSHHQVILSITNTGEGISGEHIGRIFDRFYRTDASRSRAGGGYGLGLAIAKAIIEQHKGKISAKSVVSESTTFSIELPCSSC